MSAAAEVSTSEDVFEFHSHHGPLPYIPDDVSVVQFFLDSYHPNRPLCHPPLSSSSISSNPRPDVGLGRDGRKWIVDDESGRGFTHAQVRLGSARCFVVRDPDFGPPPRFKNVLMDSRMRLRRAGISAKTMLVSCMFSETLFLF